MKTLTLEQWKRWAATATRNRTDDPLGAHTSARRATDEANSRHVTPRPQRTKETTR